MLFLQDIIELVEIKRELLEHARLIAANSEVFDRMKLRVLDYVQDNLWFELKESIRTLPRLQEELEKTIRELFDRTHRDGGYTKILNATEVNCPFELTSVYLNTVAQVDMFVSDIIANMKPFSVLGPAVPKAIENEARIPIPNPF